MESMDYGFHLFTDADSGENSVLCSARGCPGPGGRAEVPTSELPGSGVRRVATADRTEGG